MSVTPFSRRLPTTWSDTVGGRFFKYWPWPMPSGTNEVFFPSVGLLPPREILDWLSVAEWRFQVEISNFAGNTPRSVDEMVKPGSFYVITNGVDDPEVQGVESTTLLGNMKLGYNSDDSSPRLNAICGVELDWQENIEGDIYTYSVQLHVTFPYPSVNDDDEPGWSVAPKCQCLLSNPYLEAGQNHCIILDQSYGPSEAPDIFTTVDISIGSML